jgi:predicted nucleic-acid-binding protein
VIAIDTNVLVRFVVADEPAQSKTARDLIEGGEIWLSKTVLLETEWVLRYCYRLDREATLRTLIQVASLAMMVLEDRPAVVQALRWSQEGLDFADALHVASRGPAGRFATFDRKLHQKASALQSSPKTELLDTRS